MKEDIEQFKKENGNINYTIKELLYGVHTKIDSLNIKIDFLNKEKLDKSLFWKIVGSLCAFFLIILGFIQAGGA